MPVGGRWAALTGQSGSRRSTRQDYECCRFNTAKVTTVETIAVLNVFIMLLTSNRLEEVWTEPACPRHGFSVGTRFTFPVFVSTDVRTMSS